MNMNDLLPRAEEATQLLKALANPTRLMILCSLVDEERSVTELTDLAGVRQPLMSQQLALLRAEGLVKTRRVGRTIYYSLGSAEAARVLSVLHELYCPPSGVRTPASR